MRLGLSKHIEREGAGAMGGDQPGEFVAARYRDPAASAAGDQRPDLLFEGLQRVAVTEARRVSMSFVRDQRHPRPPCADQTGA